MDFRQLRYIVMVADCKEQGLGVTILPQMIIDLAKYDSGVAFFNLGAPPSPSESPAPF